MEAFLATPNLSGNDTTNPDLENQVIPFPLCVGEHLVGRVNGGNLPPAVETIFSVSKYEFVAERNPYFASRKASRPISFVNQIVVPQPLQDCLSAL